MAIRTGLAKVAGALRYDGWGSSLESPNAEQRPPSFLPTLSSTLNSVKDFVAHEFGAMRLARYPGKKQA